MVQTMTWIGLDVHARSVHAAIVDAQTGELRRQRLGGGVEPTGFGLARAAAAAGVELIIVAPGKTPRAAADRVKMIGAGKPASARFSQLAPPAPPM
jgi:cysteine synthase